MTIKEIKKEDINIVIDIINRNYDEVMIKTHSKDVVERLKKHNTLENWENQMKWKKIFVADNDGEIIATGALANFGDNISPKYCISNFFVEPKYHSKGIGKLLFKYILEIVKDKKIKFLHVPSSRTGFEFYRRMGFVKDSIQNDEIDEIIWMTMNIL
ncbi:GNAT family N-acetyltransferase [Clostridium beijerinckii]|uniref:Acetyltransferase n=1 Tax=Clostridium beijerinckii TaxID=1520 RepID=A0A1S8RZE0_CLOBE|nr:GNAT family N-acetyltransferase [Clostridium beijerinckii]NRY64136.1 N-acetylglutamate synthase-like GNAT family acetyltransferase [Clostridium beijerinckii]OOM58564.1 acetyltransferase [Clostridium beijerinckii]